MSDAPEKQSLLTKEMLEVAYEMERIYLEYDAGLITQYRVRQRMKEAKAEMMRLAKLADAKEEAAAMAEDNEDA